jgi:hypothetical protein
MLGGVGGGSREASPYPDLARKRQVNCYRVLKPGTGGRCPSSLSLSPFQGWRSWSLYSQGLRPGLKILRCFAAHGSGGAQCLWY